MTWNPHSTASIELDRLRAALKGAEGSADADTTPEAADRVRALRRQVVAAEGLIAAAARVRAAYQEAAQ